MHGALAGEADVEVLDFDEIGHCELGHPLVEIGRALERGADPQQHGFIEGAADQSACRPAGRCW